MTGKWPKDINVVAILPAYQEEGYIKNVVRQLKKRKREGLVQEIIVVDDGSTDKTAKIAKRAGADKVIRLEKNRGKAKAFAVGVREVAGRYSPKNTIVLTLDADLNEIRANQVRKMIEPFMGISKASKRLNMVIGEVGLIGPEFIGQRAIRLRALGGLARNTRMWKKTMKTGYGLEKALDHLIKDSRTVNANFETKRRIRMGRGAKPKRRQQRNT